jgi:hypothetical protein
MRIVAETIEEFLTLTRFPLPNANDNHLRYLGTCRGCGMPWESDDPDLLCECKDVIEFIDTKAPAT